MVNKKKGASILTAVLLVCIMLTAAMAAGCSGRLSGAGANLRYPDYSEAYYVNDYCGILSQEAEREIAVAAERISSLTGSQVVVAAVPDTQDIAIEDYSRNLANAWGIGASNKNTGVLVLLVKDSGSIRIEVGKDLEKLLTEEKAGQILDQYAMSQLEEEKWNEAATGTCMALVKMLYSYNGMDPLGNLEIVRDSQVSESAEKTSSDIDYNEATQGQGPKAHGSGRFAGCGATRP